MSSSVFSVKRLCYCARIPCTLTAAVMTVEKLTLTVPPELAGGRLDQALARLCPQHSRARLQGWIRNESVTVNGKRLRQRASLLGGETIEIVAAYKEAEQSWEQENIPLDVVFEDEHILVLNKPAGLIVHPGAGNPQHTLLNALLYHHPPLRQLPRAGIVQRLDKDTSGLMVVSKSAPAHTWLVAQLQRRLVRREYQAIVTGVMTAGGSVDAPIGRHHSKRTRMAIRASGRPATTHYRIIKKYAGHTHLLLRLESGRTHQIRVHMAHIRYPVLGDPVYGGRRRLPKNTPAPLRRLIQGFARQALHACSLGLVHPETKQEVAWDSALPEDMQTLLDALEHEQQPGNG